MMHITVAEHRLEFAGGESRELTEADVTKLLRWSARHAERSKQHQPDDLELLKIGAEMASWLNGADHKLDRMLERAPAPAVLELRITAGSERDLAFWNAP